jgi:hypothetical protein
MVLDNKKFNYKYVGHIESYNFNIKFVYIRLNMEKNMNSFFMQLFLEAGLLWCLISLIDF